jgi:hypothetical protein
VSRGPSNGHLMKNGFVKSPLRTKGLAAWHLHRVRFRNVVGEGFPTLVDDRGSRHSRDHPASVLRHRAFGGCFAFGESWKLDSLNLTRVEHRVEPQKFPLFRNFSRVVFRARGTVVLFAPGADFDDGKPIFIFADVAGKFLGPEEGQKNGDRNSCEPSRKTLIPL